MKILSPDITTPWKQRAKEACVTLHQDAVTVKKVDGYPFVELTPDVLREAASKLQNAYFVGMNTRSILEAQSSLTKKEIPQAVRSLYYSICLRLAELMQQEKLLDMNFPKSDQIFAEGTSYNLTMCTQPHIHNNDYEYDRLELLGYCTDLDRDLINRGTLSFWNLRESGLKLDEIVDFVSVVNPKHYPRIEKFTPPQDYDQYPCFAFLDGAVAHSTEEIVAMETDFQAAAMVSPRRIVNHVVLRSKLSTKKEKDFEYNDNAKEFISGKYRN